MRDPLAMRADDRVMRLEPPQPPTASDLAADADTREEFLRRVAARRGLTPDSLRLRLALTNHIPPAGSGADAASSPPSLHACSLQPRPGPSCTGAAGTADATGERDGAISRASAEPLAPVSPHAVPSGGAGTSPVIEQGDAAHRGPVRNGAGSAGVHAMGSARGASAAEPAIGRSPARSLPLTDDGMAWGEEAPARRRLHPLAFLALLLAASWLALIVISAVEAVGLLKK